MHSHNMQKNLGVIVMGGGYFAHFHINAWLRLPAVKLLAIVETDLAKHQDLKDKLRSQHSTDTLITDSLSAALSYGEADIIDIATPPASHATLIEQSINHGCPIIVCQKPFCGSYKTAKSVCEKIKHSNAKVVVHENFRFQPWYRAIKTELNKHSLGTLLNASFRLRPGDGQGPDAYLARQPYFRTMPRFLIHETGVHFIDVFRYLFGEPQAVTAELQRLNPSITGEDAGFFIFHYNNGMRAQFDGNRLLDHAADNTRLTMGEMLIEGTQGSLALYGNGALSLRRFGDIHWTDISYQFNDIDFGGDCVFNTQQHISDHLQRGTPLENLASDYVRNLELEETIYDAAAAKAKTEC